MSSPSPSLEVLQATLEQASLNDAVLLHDLNQAASSSDSDDSIWSTDSNELIDERSSCTSLSSANTERIFGAIIPRNDAGSVNPSKEPAMQENQKSSEASDVNNEKKETAEKSFKLKKIKDLPLDDKNTSNENSDDFEFWFSSSDENMTEVSIESDDFHFE